MPSHYAHYRFGSRAIADFPPEIRRVIRQFRPMYDAGLHGPDIFFYHNILFRDKIVKLGAQTHKQTGDEFFTRNCKHLRLEPNEAALAYLYGVLTHYCLDSTVHPFVYESTRDGKIHHAELETEFDRYLLQLDGNRQPNTFDCSPHIRLTWGECVTAAEFYPPVSPASVSLSVRGMASAVKWLAMPNGSFRRTVENAAGSKLRRHFMGRTPNKNCAHLNGDMLVRYTAAEEKLPAMVAALQAHMSHNAPLGDLFEATFNG